MIDSSDLFGIVNKDSSNLFNIVNKITNTWIKTFEIENFGVDTSTFRYTFDDDAIDETMSVTIEWNGQPTQSCSMFFSTPDSVPKCTRTFKYKYFDIEAYQSVNDLPEYWQRMEIVQHMALKEFAEELYQNKVYSAYRALGGNGTGEAMYKELSRLTLKKKEKNMGFNTRDYLFTDVTECESFYKLGHSYFDNSKIGYNDMKTFVNKTAKLDFTGQMYITNNPSGLLKKLMPSIKKVHYSDPCTIIIWDDGTKTIVRCQEGDIYDEERGFLMCVMKKLYGGKGDFNNVLKKWVWERESDKDEA